MACRQEWIGDEPEFLLIDAAFDLMRLEVKVKHSAAVLERDHLQSSLHEIALRVMFLVSEMRKQREGGSDADGQ